jgi:hypothetical protein
VLSLAVAASCEAFLRYLANSGRQKIHGSTALLVLGLLALLILPNLLQYSGEYVVGSWIKVEATEGSEKMKKTRMPIEARLPVFGVPLHVIGYTATREIPADNEEPVKPALFRPLVCRWEYVALPVDVLFVLLLLAAAETAGRNPPRRRCHGHDGDRRLPGNRRGLPQVRGAPLALAHAVI